MSATDTLRHTLYPETRAGGFAAIDGAVQFYGRIAALTKASDTVLELGAGRGEYFLEDPVPYRRALRDHRGRCGRVIGADIDPVVLENPGLNEAHVIGADGRLPLPDNSVDLITAEAVFEHVESPEVFAREITRVLKPGGWLCARTPNRWGYIALGASLVPNALHVAALRYLQPDRQAQDVFPTHYRLNTRAALRRHFPPEAWEDCSYTWTSEPAYFGTSRLGWRVAQGLARVLPPAMGATWMLFLRKRGA
jgi:SAM-dependent methyltransferase